MTKKQDIKTQQNSATTTIEQSPTPVHNVEVQTKNESTTKPTMMNTSQKHIGLLATPNPSPYVHFINVPYPIQS
ncbi:unnamed protein product, partial [Rotaria magnacalcarata]